MPTRHSTRAACRQLPRYKGSATSAQLIFGLRRIILNRESVRQAVSLSNANSKQVANHHLLTKSTLQRYYTALPPHLQLPENATEGALLGWLITYEGGRRAERQQGRSLFGSAQEELLCQWINARCLINAAVGRREIIEHACTLLPAGSQSTMEGWYKGFRRRWTDLHSRLEQTTPHARLAAEVNTANVDNFFQLLAQFTHLPAAQVWAADETGIHAESNRVRRVVALAGTKRVKAGKYRTSKHIGVLHMGNADGESAPMICIFQGQYLTQEHAAQLDPKALIGVQENGQFIHDHFIGILQHLITHAPQERPLLFILDGAGSHISLAAAKFAVDNGIDILLLPSNMTHKLQVADVAIFGPLKTVYASVSGRLRRERTRNGRTGATRVSDIIAGLVEAWKAAVTPQNVIAGFRRTGICPFDPHAWKVTSAVEVARLGGLPLMMTPTQSPTPSVAAAVLPHVDNLSVHSSSPAKETGGKQPAKRVATPRLRTEAGVLLTAAGTMAQLQSIADFKTQQAEDKEQKRREKEAKKAEKEAAGPAVAQGKGRKRKAAEVDRGQENMEPNTAAQLSAETLRVSHPAMHGDSGLRLHPLMVLMASGEQSRESSTSAAAVVARAVTRVRVRLGGDSTVLPVRMQARAKIPLR